MYKPLQTGKAKISPLNHPYKYKPPGGLYLENYPQIQSIWVQVELTDYSKPDGLTSGQY